MSPERHDSARGTEGHLFTIKIVNHCMKRVGAAQAWPTLCDRMIYAVHGVLQAGTLEWAAFPFSRASSQPRDQTQVSRVAGGFFTS